MTRDRFIVNPNGPVLPPGSARGAVRMLTLGQRDWELSAPKGDWGSEWTWKRTSLLTRIWTLSSERGMHLVLCQASMLGRVWRAEAATAGWTLKRSLISRTVVSDDTGEVVLSYEPRWWGRGPIVPASGPDLKLRWHWPGGFTLDTSEGHELLAIKRGPGLFNRTHRVTISDAAREREDLMPLLALTWLQILSVRHAHAH